MPREHTPYRDRWLPGLLFTAFNYLPPQPAGWGLLLVALAGSVGSLRVRGTRSAVPKAWTEGWAPAGSVSRQGLR